MDLGHLSSKRTSIEWRIENFLDRKDYNGCIKSPNFLLSDASFHIQIYPNGVTMGWVSLYLYKESSPSDVRVEYTIGIKKSVDGLNFKSNNGNHLFPSEAEGWGYAKFIKISQLTIAENIFGPDGTLIVFCEIRVADDSTAEAETQTSMPDSLETLSRDVENIFVSGCHTDVLIEVKGKKFSAHRSILSSRSSVFRSMFELSMKEKETGSVKITDCDPESFRSFLLFLYSGKLDVITSDNALDLYVTAEKYNVQDLKEPCRECMMRNLYVDSVCDVVPLAVLHEDQELLTRATDYFVKNASEILETSKWQNFAVENFTVANELLIKMVKKFKNNT